MEANLIQVGPEGQQWRTTLPLNWREGQPATGAENVKHTLYRDDEVIFTSDTPINAFLFDRQGTLWIAVWQQGLFRLQHTFLRTLSVEDGLPFKDVYVILEDRHGTIWLGSWEGVVRIDSALTPSSPFDGTTWPSLYEDRAGTIWVGSDPLCQVQQDRCEAVDLGLEQSTASSDATNAMYEDRRGRFWIGWKIRTRARPSGWSSTHLGHPDHPLRPALESCAHDHRDPRRHAPLRHPG